MPALRIALPLPPGPSLCSCINCIHVLPDLAAIERKYAGAPFTVVGVHSAKFDNEKDSEAIRSAGGEGRAWGAMPMHAVVWGNLLLAGMCLAG